MAKSIKEIWIDKFGSPKEIITDQGRQYISKNFKTLIENHQVKHTLTSAHNPTCNGISERINQTIGIFLRLCKGKNLKDLKQHIHTRLNFNVNSALNATLYEVVFKRDVFNNKKRELHLQTLIF